MLDELIRPSCHAGFGRLLPLIIIGCDNVSGVIQE
jgi:hypothetical protein